MEALDATGHFDEQFFLYFEETDLMRRMKTSGWQVWYTPKAVAVHIEGYTTGAKGGQDEERPVSDHWFRSRNAYWQKHHGWLTRAVADAAWLSGTALYLCRCAVTGKSTRLQRHALGQFWRHRGKA